MAKSNTIVVKGNRDTGSIKLGEVTKDLLPGDQLVVNGKEVTVTSTDLASKFQDRWLTFCARQRFSFPIGDVTVVVKKAERKETKAA